MNWYAEIERVAARIKEQAQADKAAAATAVTSVRAEYLRGSSIRGHHAATHLTSLLARADKHEATLKAERLRIRKAWAQPPPY